MMVKILKHVLTTTREAAATMQHGSMEHETLVHISSLITGKLKRIVKLWHQDVNHCKIYKASVGRFVSWMVTLR